MPPVKSPAVCGYDWTTKRAVSNLTPYVIRFDHNHLSGDHVNEAVARPRKRLSPQERKEEIIEKAIEFFAEEGFDSSTRGLANRLGVTQPLLYRYFPSKGDIVAEVYQRVYLNRWQEEWSILLLDRAQPVEVRLNSFYTLYTNSIFERKWMRIYLFAGLRGVDINQRYMVMVRDKILKPIIQEVLFEFGGKVRAATEREIEFTWAMHGGIFYFGIRKLIYDNCGDADLKQIIADDVAAMLFGLKRFFNQQI